MFALWCHIEEVHYSIEVYVKPRKISQYQLLFFSDPVYDLLSRHMMSKRRTGSSSSCRAPVTQHQSLLVGHCRQAPLSLAANLMRLSANYYDND